MASRLSRRRFLSHSTQAAAVALGAGALSCSEKRVEVSRTAVAQTRKIGANDRIVIALLGAGGRGSEDTRHACRGENVACAAVCDIADFRLKENVPTIHKVMEEEKKITGVSIDTVADFRRVLDRKDIDAVIIGTPDLWHMPMFIAAADAGKHIYQEKPMSKSVEQGWRMLEAAQRHPELTIQIGTQRRSDGNYAKAKALIDAGKIGEIKFARCYDCRNWILNGDPFLRKDALDAKGIDWDTFQAPSPHKVPFDQYRYLAWRWFWDYANGLVTDVGVHVLDIVHLLTGSTVPKSVVCNGGVYALNRWETPDIVNAVWDYGTHSVAFTSNFANGFQQDGLTLYGTKGTLEVVGHNIKVYEGDPGKVTAEFPSEMKPWSHQVNWIDSIRSGKKPNAPVEVGVSSLLPLHLANMAYRQGRKITWNPESRKATAA